MYSLGVCVCLYVCVLEFRLCSKNLHLHLQENWEGMSTNTHTLYTHTYILYFVS
jgi:hypothetical protein